MRLSLRFLLVACVAVAALAATAPAFASDEAEQVDGFYVYKDGLTFSEVELRDAHTGRVQKRWRSRGLNKRLLGCFDPSYTLSGASWHSFQPYLVNKRSAPSYLNASKAFSDVVDGHEAWEGRYETNCWFLPAKSSYKAVYGGTTTVDPSLAWLELDGMNTVGFLPLTGTICDGPGVVACVIGGAEDNGAWVEVDMLIEADLAYRLDGNYRWTTGDRTWSRSGAGELAVIDVATHEWGHFAGLEHVADSPQLTMYPEIHDGMQTLGRGDMLGLLRVYPPARGRSK